MARSFGTTAHPRTATRFVLIDFLLFDAPTRNENCLHRRVFFDERRKLAWRLLPKSSGSRLVEGAEALRQGATLLAGATRLNIGTPLDWNAVSLLKRSDQRMAHMHAFVGDAVGAYERSSDPSILETVLHCVTVWSDCHSWPSHSRTMAYHDETTARRVAYWTALVVAIRASRAAYDITALLTRLDEEVRILSATSFHAGVNKHGMFQDLALLYYAALLGPESLSVDLPLDRLVKYFEWSVAPDGVHKEHSPEYNYLIARNISAHLGFFRTFSSEIANRVELILGRMARFAAQIVTPEGRYPPLGDTVGKKVPPGYFQTFCGKNSPPPLENAAIFKEGGLRYCETTRI